MAEKHKCFNCIKLVPLSKFGCPRCWFSLSEEAREKVNKAYYAYAAKPSNRTLAALRDAQLEANMELK